MPTARKKPAKFVVFTEQHHQTGIKPSGPFSKLETAEAAVVAAIGMPSVVFAQVWTEEDVKKEYDKGAAVLGTNKHAGIAAAAKLLKLVE